MMKSAFALTCAALWLLAAAPAEATNNCSKKKPLVFFSYDTAGILWQDQREDSPLDGGSQRIMIHVLDNSSVDPPYDYAGAYADCTGIEGKALGDVRNLSFEFLNTSTHPVHVSGGSPRISVELDTDGDAATDQYAYLSAVYCDLPLSEDPAWSRADFTGRVTAGCSFYTSEGGPYASDGSKSAWRVFADAHPTWKVVQAYLVADEDGTAFVDRVAFHNRMFNGPGAAANVKNCGNEGVC